MSASVAVSRSSAARSVRTSPRSCPCDRRLVKCSFQAIREAPICSRKASDPTATSAATFERWNISNRVVPDGELRENALAWAQRLAKGPTAAHAVTKRFVRYGLAHGSRQADRYLLDAATPLFESHDMQHAVGELLSQGTRKFLASHDQFVFENR